MYRKEKPILVDILSVVEGCNESKVAMSRHGSTLLTMTVTSLRVTG
jgi:hypothetical protein